MKLTPMDITNKEFKKGIRGYNIEEVDEFLEEIVNNYEELYKENSNLKEKLTNINEKVEHYSKIESTIQNTLVLAQNAAEQAKSSAQKEAELILKNANETAQKVLDKSHNDVIAINDEYERVKQEFIKFRAKYRNFMNTQLETFDDLEKDFIKNYNVSDPVEETEIQEKDIDLEEKEVKISDKNIGNYDQKSIAEDLNEIKSFFAQD
ncbi:DivIVA domain-containing protein [Clostridium weizhouense]|uniref:DivIVA domain-containing protein n=1 Tax=Clostridium weizhouense TaxID=2859781 RepID=A0ABS7AQH9_9CLOT|nr:DivIVA domain-containing protein [Clostridium weizhouense]MBW6410919.1 DivIVA domain-containing protein [Clostridium weizhouense]